MNFLFRLSTIATVLSVLYFIILPMQADAFSASPPIIELEANPGETIQTNIRIQNTSDVKRFYAFSVQKFIPKGEHGQQEFLPPSETSGLPEWIYFDRPILELEAGQGFTLPVVLRVPETADPGGHYAAVLFSEQADLANGAVGIVPRTGVLVLLTVKGNILKSFSLDEFSVSPERASHLPLHFTAVLSNTGNVHIQPEGEIRVKNMFGNTVASMPFNPSGGRVLPSSRRSYQLTWQKQEPVSDGFMSELVEEWRNFAFGKYTADMTVQVDSVEETHAIEIWVWPWRTLVLIAVLCILAAGLYYGRKQLRS